MIENLKVCDNENLEGLLEEIKSERKRQENFRYGVAIDKVRVVNVVIENVNFSTMKWWKCEFINVRFINCNFGRSEFYESEFRECQFYNCNFRVGAIDEGTDGDYQCSFRSCKLETILIKDSDLLEIYIRKCKLKLVTIENSRLDHGMILESDIDNLIFKECYLINFVLTLDKPWKSINFYNCITDGERELISFITEDPSYIKGNAKHKYSFIILLNDLYRVYLYSGIKEEASRYYIVYKDECLRNEISDLIDLIKRRNFWRYERISEIFKALFKIFGSFANKHLFGYGERVFVLVFSSFALLIGFSLIYFSLGISYMGELIKIDFTKTVIENFEMFFKSMYFSVITFSTLGYGEIIPANSLARFVSMVQVVVGVVYTAAITATIYKKISKE